MQFDDSTEVLKGIDVSHYQGSINWQEVKHAGYTYAFAKASGGDHVQDATLQMNWQGMQEVGMVRGAYLFYHAKEDPMKQFALYASRVDLQKNDLPPVVDIETLNKQHESLKSLSEDLQVLLNALEDRYGATPIIYTSYGFWNQHLRDTFGNYPLWVAHYGVKEPKLPNGWSDWTFWQYSQSGRVPGISGDVDLDVFRGNINDLMAVGRATD